MEVWVMKLSVTQRERLAEIAREAKEIVGGSLHPDGRAMTFMELEDECIEAGDLMTSAMLGQPPRIPVGLSDGFGVSVDSRFRSAFSPRAAGGERRLPADNLTHPARRLQFNLAASRCGSHDHIMVPAASRSTVRDGIDRAGQLCCRQLSQKSAECREKQLGYWSDVGSVASTSETAYSLTR
jgi:hypothetical protein